MARNAVEANAASSFGPSQADANGAGIRGGAGKNGDRGGAVVGADVGGTNRIGACSIRGGFELEVDFIFIADTAGRRDISARRGVDGAFGAADVFHSPGPNAKVGESIPGN